MNPIIYSFRFVFFQNGLFQSDLRACNRKALGEIHIPSDKLIEETRAFATALDSNIPLRGTIVGGLDQLVNSAVTNFQSYMSKLKTIKINLVTKVRPYLSTVRICGCGRYCMSLHFFALMAEIPIQI